MKSNGYYFATAVAAISVCAAVMFGLWLTKEPNCLWGLFFVPGITNKIRILVGNKKNNKNDEEQSETEKK